MKRQTKQTSHEQEQRAEAQSQQAGQEFATPEDLLRHDARQTLVPPGIAERLGKSIQTEPKPERSWWQRLLGR